MRAATQPTTGYSAPQPPPGERPQRSAWGRFSDQLFVARPDRVAWAFQSENAWLIAKQLAGGALMVAGFTLGLNPPLIYAGATLLAGGTIPKMKRFGIDRHYAARRQNWIARRDSERLWRDFDQARTDYAERTGVLLDAEGRTPQTSPTVGRQQRAAKTQPQWTTAAPPTGRPVPGPMPTPTGPPVNLSPPTSRSQPLQPVAQPTPTASPSPQPHATSKRPQTTSSTPELDALIDGAMTANPTFRRELTSRHLVRDGAPINGQRVIEEIAEGTRQFQNIFLTAASDFWRRSTANASPAERASLKGQWHDAVSDVRLELQRMGADAGTIDMVDRLHTVVESGAARRTPGAAPDLSR